MAMINGETTLKRIFRRNGKVILHPENKEMKDIVVKDCEIRRLVEYIRVMKDNSIIIVLKGGIQIREPIETNN